LTTISVDRVAMGRRAGGVLLGRLAGRQKKHTLVDVGFKIIERLSTRR
jgi:LacI family gluconate utilization system Gnt-I transcriptional repressor